MLDEWIIRIVRRLERNYRRGIYPWMVQSHLPMYRAEQTLRRDMMRLAVQGRLIRVGEESSRLGYRVGSPGVGAISGLRREAAELDAQYAALREKLLDGNAAINERYEALRRQVVG